MIAKRRMWFLMLPWCAVPISSCCQSFWVSRGRLSSGSAGLRATVYLIDSTCPRRSGYLVRVEDHSGIVARKFIGFEEAGKDYEADFERVVLDSLQQNKLTFHYSGKDKVRTSDVLCW